MNAAERLEPVVEDWQKALAVVAHPRWTGQGKEIIYCLLTSGEAGIDGVAPAECGPLREAEQIESARIVGVSSVEFLGQPDGTIEYGVALRRVITEVIRLPTSAGEGGSAHDETSGAAANYRLATRTG